MQSTGKTAPARKTAPVGDRFPWFHRCGVPVDTERWPRPPNAPHVARHYRPCSYKNNSLPIVFVMILHPLTATFDQSQQHETAQQRRPERPQCRFFGTRRDHEWVDVTSDQVFKGKTVVVFPVPAPSPGRPFFSTHVPRYNQLAPELKRHGVDEIICVSVNDAFGDEHEWRAEQKASNITFLPDGNGDFSRGMGMHGPKQDRTFGERPWR